jgi:integrase
MDAITVHASVVKDLLLPSASFKTFTTKYWNRCIDWIKEQKIPEDRIDTENTLYRCTSKNFSNLILLIHFGQSSLASIVISRSTKISILITLVHFLYFSNGKDNNTSQRKLQFSLEFKSKITSNEHRMSVNTFCKYWYYYLDSTVGMRTIELTDLRWNDIEVSEQGIKVTIRYSKSDSAGNAYVFIIPSNKGDASVCPESSATLQNFIGSKSMQLKSVAYLQKRTIH